MSIEYKNLLLEVKDYTALITVNRPRVLNALNYETVQELGHVFNQLEQQKEVRSVIITGAGDKAFVAGADISEFTKLDTLSGQTYIRHIQQVFNQIENFPRPVIAAINGFALGGGFELALACHILLASEDAKLGLPEVGIGIFPAAGGTQRLPRLIGRSRALELILSGYQLNAQDAYEWGILNHIYPAENLMSKAKDMANLINSKAPVAVTSALKSVTTGSDMPLERALEMDVQLTAICTGTLDLKEGATAFLEKRPPMFHGR